MFVLRLCNVCEVLKKYGAFKVTFEKVSTVQPAETDVALVAW